MHVKSGWPNVEYHCPITIMIFASVAKRLARPFAESANASSPSINLPTVHQCRHVVTHALWMHALPTQNMVNPGHSSRGCSTCRLRRIKCDEARPTCINCANSKRTCLGYNIKALPQSNGEWWIRNRSVDASSSQRSLYAGTEHASLRMQRSQATDLPMPIGQAHVDRATNKMVSLMGTIFGSLTAAACSLEARKELLQQYRGATLDLASILSSVDGIAGSALPSYFFALYEVSWQTNT